MGVLMLVEESIADEHMSVGEINKVTGVVDDDSKNKNTMVVIPIANDGDRCWVPPAPKKKWIRHYLLGEQVKKFKLKTKKKKRIFYSYIFLDIQVCLFVFKQFFFIVFRFGVYTVFTIVLNIFIVSLSILKITSLFKL